MDWRDEGVRLRRQEGEEVIFRLAFLGFADRLPARPDLGEKCKRPAFIEREPDASAFRLVERKPSVTAAFSSLRFVLSGVVGKGYAAR
jgi:hypothetical protein